LIEKNRISSCKINIDVLTIFEKLSGKGLRTTSQVLLMLSIRALRGRM